MINKKIAIISASVVIVVAAVIVGAVFLFQNNSSPTDSTLPVVFENTFPDIAAEITETLSNVNLPEVDNPGLPVTEEELAITPEEEEIIKEIESVQAENTGSVEKSQEQIKADVVAIKKAAEEAAAQPDVVQPVQMQPKEIEPVKEEPSKDADGYIYTKEQAVKLFTSNTDAMAQIKDPDLLAHAKTKASFSQEAFDADLNQLLTDPYSSPILTPYFESYRKYGSMSYLIVNCSEWLFLGGDDAVYAERETR